MVSQTFVRKIMYKQIIKNENQADSTITHHHSESVREEDAGHHGKSYPGKDLKRVVGACYVVEQKALGDGTLLGPLGRAQVGEHKVADEVAHLAEHKDGKSYQELGLRGRDERRCAERVANDSTENPVICTVLKQVRERHGGTRKLVDENGFQLSLQEVSDPANDTNKSHIVVWDHVGSFSVKKLGSQCVQGDEEHWSEIFY